MYKHLPNQLTVLRLVLAAVFFLTLNQYRYTPPSQGCTQDSNIWLWLALSVFVFAAITDILDGYLARKWHAESGFGRIMDPFCDKVLILGAFIYLAGPRFTAEKAGVFVSVSSVYPWMVAAMLARELLVTGVRGELEGAGVQFGANFFGKAKMIIQSIGVPVLLGGVALDTVEHATLGLAMDFLMYLIVTVTVLSGGPYLLQASIAIRQQLDHEQEQQT